MGIISDRMEARAKELKETLTLPDLDMDFVFQKLDSGVIASLISEHSNNEARLMTSLIKHSCVSPDMSELSDKEIDDELSALTQGDRIKLNLFISKFILGLDTETTNDLMDFRKLSQTSQT